MPKTKKVKFECDGCGRQEEFDPDVFHLPEIDSVEELRAYVRAHPMPMCDCDDFWGWMEVGSPSWHRYHDEGIRPMQELAETIVAEYKKRIERN
jgi:hypothetical protein